MLHSVNERVYGGETLLTWDSQKQAVTFHDFTTTGFKTEGTMSFKNGLIVSHELVIGNTRGVTEVRATSKLLPDEDLHVESEHLKNGE